MSPFLPSGNRGQAGGRRVPASFRNKISPHQLGISDLLAVARITESLPPRLVLFGVEPQELGTGLGLSEKLAGVAEELALMVALELADLGLPLRQRSNG